MVRVLVLFLALGMSTSAFGITHTKSKRKTVTRKTVATSRASSRRLNVRKASFVVTPHEPVSHLSRLRKARRKVFWNPWTEPTFADSTSGDRVDGEDLVVRRAAVQALGPYNGTVVAVDPTNGRILTIVNQSLAFKGGFQPCSTIKLVAAFAGLNEGIIDRDSTVRVGRRTSMDLTEAIARSNNPFFAMIGSRLGYDKVKHYGKMFGLGEKACWETPEETPGGFPDGPPDSSEGGMGMMTVFGTGITLTPLQLASIVTAMANGGTLYYLQHPRTQADVDHFVPRVKRQLPIANLINEIKPGMEGATEYGTGRRAAYNANGIEPIFGKTGTCSDQRYPGIHLGWFGSFSEANNKKLVVVVLLTGGRPINGPVASGVAGAVYRELTEQGYFGGPKVAAVSAPLLATN